MGSLPKVKAANWGLDRIIDGTGLLGIAIMIALSLFVSIVMMSRHVAALNIPGFFDASTYVLIVFPLITAAFTLRAERHITVDVFVSLMTERGQAALRIVAYLSSLIFAFVFVWQAVRWWFLLYSHNVETHGVWLIPKWILVGLIIFGCILLILQIIRIMSRDLSFIKRDKSSGTSSLRDLLFIAGFIIGFAGAVCLYMEGNIIAATLLLFVVLLFSGVPVFLAMGTLGTVALFFGVGLHGLVQIPQVMYNALDSFPLTCLPLFIFSGIVMERGKLVDDIFKCVEAWIGNFTPSLLLVTIIVGMLISSLTGSTTAATAMLAATALPVLISRGFKKSLGSGLISASASGSLIPPSLGYVVYAVLVEESIGELFIAALFPAITIFAFFAIYILLVNLINKKSFFQGGEIPNRSYESISLTRKLVLTGKALPVLFAPVLVLGSIYFGIFTPTEAAAALLLYSMILTVFVKKTLNLRGLYEACSNGAMVSTMILCILATAFLFAGVVSQLRLNVTITTFAETLQLGPIGVLVLIFFTILILGMCMSGVAITPITLPVFYPMAIAVGINPLWLGVFYIINAEMSTFTPPFGMDFFIIKSMLGIPYNEMIKGILPFISLFILTLLVITVFPEIVLWLPATMK